MSRLLTIALGPELVMTLITIGVYLVCARHDSGSTADVGLLERLVVILPPVAVALVFLTVLVPGNANWLWLARALVVSIVGCGIFVLRLVEGFGPGARGQDAAYVIALMLAGAAASIGISFASALILAKGNEGLSDWFRERPVLGSTLTLASAIPIGIALLFTISIGGGLLLGFISAFRR